MNRKPSGEQQIAQPPRASRFLRLKSGRESRNDGGESMQRQAGERAGAKRPRENDQQSQREGQKFPKYTAENQASMNRFLKFSTALSDTSLDPSL